MQEHHISLLETIIKTKTDIGQYIDQRSRRYLPNNSAKNDLYQAFRIAVKAVEKKQFTAIPDGYPDIICQSCHIQAGQCPIQDYVIDPQRRGLTPDSLFDQVYEKSSQVVTAQSLAMKLNPIQRQMLLIDDLARKVGRPGMDYFREKGRFP